MSEVLAKEVIAERDAVRQTFESAVLADDEIVGAFMTGSVAAGTADQWSDLDYHLYVKSRPWDAEKMKAWLRAAGLEPTLYYWNNFEKHVLVIGRWTGLDLHTRARYTQADVLTWPHLFFAEKDILKDEDGLLVPAVRANEPLDKVNPENDFNGYAISLLNLAGRLAVDASIVELSSAHADLVEAKARTMRQLPIGSALWREPSRHAEATLPPDGLAKLSRIAFMGSVEELKALTIAELTGIAAHSSVVDEARLAIIEALNQLS